MNSEPEMNLHVALRRGSPAKVTGRPKSGVRHVERTNLLAYIGGLLPNLKRAQRRIATAVLDDPEQTFTRSISDLAADCGVSAGSIVQFCRSLGFSGFPMFKICLARELAEPAFPFFGQSLQSKRGSHSILRRVFEEHIQSLHQTFKLNTPRALTDAAASVLKAKRIVLFAIGLSYPVAYSLYARLRFMGLPAFIDRDSHMQLAAAAEMRKRDVGIGISVSGSTRETVECLRLSKARKAKTICITNSVDSPLARTADIQLYAAPSEVKYFQAPLASRLTQLALADTILVIVALHRKSSVMAHLRRAEEHLLQRRVSRRSVGGV